MAAWFETDWCRMFVPQLSLPEVIVRGTLVYLAIVLLLRVILKRQAGKVGMSDLLVVTIVAGVCRNPLVRDAASITDGLLVVATVLLWSFVLDWLSFYSPFMHKLLHPRPVQLIRQGVVLAENLACELMTDAQLQSKLRREGVNDPALVAEAWLEGDGHVSVVPRRLGRPEGFTPGNGIVSGRESGTGGSATTRTSGGGPLLHPSSADGAQRCLLATETTSVGPTPLLRMQVALEEKIAWHLDRMVEHERAAADLTTLLREARN